MLGPGVNNSKATKKINLEVHDMRVYSYLLVGSLYSRLNTI